MKKRAICAVAANLLIPALVALGLVMMFTGLGGTKWFTAGDLTALRYFTVLSNLFAGAAALLYAGMLLPVLRGRRAQVPGWCQILLLMATASVALTFLVVVGFFLPVLRLRGMFDGANLWFHLVVPLLSIASYVLLDRFGRTGKGAALFAVLPMLLYGLVYTGNCLLHGVGDYADHPNDWYHFLVWGYPVGVGIFLVLIAVTVGMAALLQWGSRIGQK